jgi:hypothetical protein
MNLPASKIVAALFFARSFVASSAAADPSATCPNQCAKCADAVKQSLDWLATRQNEQGCWSGRNGSDLVNTAFAVLAFHANGSTFKEGPYAKNIEKAVEYFLKVVPKNEHQRENSPTKGLKMPLHNWETAFVALAMAEVYAHKPDDKHKEFLVWLIDLMCKNQSGDGWGHLSLRYNIKADVTMYGSFISPTQWNMAALGVLRNLGCAGPDDVFKRGVIFLRGGISQSGGVMYYGSTMRRTTSPIRVSENISCRT